MKCDRQLFNMIVKSVFNDGKIVWSREEQAEAFVKNPFKSKPVSLYKFVYKVDNHSLFFNIVNCTHPGIEEWFKNVVKSLYEFLKDVKTPMKVKTIVGFGSDSYVSRPDAILNVCVMSGNRTLFKIEEMYFSVSQPPKYYVSMFRNLEMFGIVRVTPSMVRKVGLNPDEIFNSEGYPINTRLYLEALKRINNMKYFNYFSTMMNNLFLSLIRNNGFYILNEGRMRLFCYNSVAGVVENPELFLDRGVEELSKTVKQLYKELGSFIKSLEYWKKVSLEVAPVVSPDKGELEFVISHYY